MHLCVQLIANPCEYFILAIHLFILIALFLALEAASALAFSSGNTGRG